MFRHAKVSDLAREQDTQRGTIVASAVPFLAPVPYCPYLLLPPLWVSNHDK
jgi:hypothetical protein